MNVLLELIWIIKFWLVEGVLFGGRAKNIEKRGVEFNYHCNSNIYFILTNINDKDNKYEEHEEGHKDKGNEDEDIDENDIG